MDYTDSLKQKYPPNNQRALEKEKKSLEKVTTGKVITKKKSAGKKLAEAFLTEDVGDIKNHIVYERIIPILKDTIVDIFETAIEMAIFGRSDSRRGKASSNGYIAYNNVSKRPENNSRTAIAKPGYNMVEIICETRDDGERIIDDLVDALEEYGHVTVDELYQLAGVSSQSSTDRHWGWTDLRGVYLSKIREGFLLNMPKPVQID